MSQLQSQLKDAREAMSKALTVMRETALAMTEAEKRGFDAGLLFCIDALKKVYGRMGWQRIDSDVYMLDEREAKTPIASKNITMSYPLGKSEFPSGDIDLAGADW